MLADFVKDKEKQINKQLQTNSGLHFAIYKQISFKVGWMIDTTKLFSLIAVWMTLTIIRNHNCVKKAEISSFIFSQISQSVWMKFGKLPLPVNLLKLILFFPRDYHLK